MGKKTGRPIQWPEPKTPLANRLQDSLPVGALFEISKKYMGCAGSTASRYLSGDRDAPVGIIENVALATGRNPGWIAFGVGPEMAADVERNGPPPRDVEAETDLALAALLRNIEDLRRAARGLGAVHQEDALAAVIAMGAIVRQHLDRMDATAGRRKSV